MPSPFTRGDGGLVMPRRSGRNVMHSHRALRRGPAHHLGRIAKIERVANVALGERRAQRPGTARSACEPRRASALRGRAKPVAVHAIEPTTKNRATKQAGEFHRASSSGRSVSCSSKTAAARCQRQRRPGMRGVALSCCARAVCADAVGRPALTCSPSRARAQPCGPLGRSASIRRLCLRKLDVLETTLGTSLFERRKSGPNAHAQPASLSPKPRSAWRRRRAALENALATRRRIARRRGAPDDERRLGRALRHALHACVSGALPRRVG